MASAFAPPGTSEHALASWVKEEGGFIGDVAVEKRDGVRGLYATKDVPKGKLLLSVPEACCISADEDPQWGLSLRELATDLAISRTLAEFLWPHRAASRPCRAARRLPPVRSPRLRSPR